jgi:hypothetical protein
MSVKYLYLDDEQEQQTLDFKELLESEVTGLEIVLAPPKSFGEEIKRIKKEDYDGLMLDLRLDVKSDAEYRAFSLAQELRTRATEGRMKDIPMVVCSTDRKLKESYNKDSTSHDLFDRKYLKNDDLVDRSESVAKELVALAKGYKQITQIRAKKGGAGPQLKRMFLLEDEQLNALDIRLVDHFGEVQGRLPVHEYARFILNEMILISGPLVSNEIICARLGIDVESKSIDELFDRYLKKFRYKGPFNEYWNRWWWHLIDSWWSNRTNTHLSILTAEERTVLLKKLSKIDSLNPAKPIEDIYRTKYWTVCELYKKPLDLINGILVEVKKERMPWQDKPYMSTKAALDVKSKANNIYPHQLEKEKVKALKKQIDAK